MRTRRIALLVLTLASVVSVGGLAHANPPAPAPTTALRAPTLPGANAARAHADKWQGAVEARLRGAAIVDDHANPKASANATRIVVLRAPDGRRAFRGVWKPISGENATIEPYPAGSPFAGISPYPLKSLYMNEVRASKLARALGLEAIVPPVVEGDVGGEHGSLQMFVEGAERASEVHTGETLDRPSAEKLRVFDYLIGNADRMGGNLLVRRENGRVMPVAIDNALSFPEGPTKGLRERPFPVEWLAGHTGPLLPETKAMIQAIDPHVVARTLLSTKATPRQVAHVLRRLEHMKRDPSFLEITADGLDGARAMLARVADAAESRDQGLEPATIDRINAVIAAEQR